MSLLKKYIRAQAKGSFTGATVNRKLDSRHAALVLFNECKFRLLDINNWCSGAIEFQLTDASGKQLEAQMPKPGNLLRIKFPATSKKKNLKNYWLSIEAFENTKDLVADEELYGFIVKPVNDPSEPAGESYPSSTTVTGAFLIYRQTSVVYVMERGLNEVLHPSGSFFIKLRNTAVAGLCKLGLSDPHWKELVSGILYPLKN